MDIYYHIQRPTYYSTKIQLQLKKNILTIRYEKKESKTIQYIVRNIFKKNGEEIIMEKNGFDLQKKKYKKNAQTKLNMKKQKKISLTSNIIKNTLKDVHSPKASIKDDNWIEQIHSVNLRTKASYNLPCCLCGSNSSKTQIKKEELVLRQLQRINSKLNLLPENNES